MHPSLRMVEKVEELVARQRDDTPYDYRTLFPTDGMWVRRASQKKLAFLKKLDEQVRAMLWPEERVVFLSTGVVHSFWESYLVGWAMYYLNRRALVLTTERLLLIQIDSRHRPRALRSQILLRGVERFTRSLLGNTVLRLTSGTRLVFIRVPRRDRKALTELTAAGKAAATRDGAGGNLQQLCPYCYQPVAGHPKECPACKGAFKWWKKAGLLSLAFPGLGDIYLGHWQFAVLEILVAALFWTSIILAAVVPDPEVPTTAADIVAGVLFVFLFMHGVDAFATMHIAKKGHSPAEPPVGRAGVSAAHHPGGNR